MHTPVIQRTNWAIITLLVLLVGCKKSTDTDAVTAANSACQLQSELTVINSSQQATTYDYNSNGQLIKSVSTPSSGKPITYTYTYDAAGNVVSAITQGTIANTNFTSTGSYEYTDGRLTKLTSQSSSTLVTSDINSYSYDGSGRLATYSSSSSDPNYGTESYTFTNGVLTSGAITRAGQSLTLTVTNGRVASIVNPNGSQTRYTYDANGYATRADYVDKTGALQSYTTFEYSPTPYKQASTPYRVVPILEIYGTKYLSHSRDAVYNADGSLKAETRYQYQINSQGYLARSSYVQNISGVGGQTTSTTTYTYSNCQ